MHLLSNQNSVKSNHNLIFIKYRQINLALLPPSDFHETLEFSPWLYDITYIIYLYDFQKTFLDSSKFKKVAVMIPYKDGLSILENLEDADGKLTMTIAKGVSLIVLIHGNLPDINIWHQES